MSLSIEKLLVGCGLHEENGRFYDKQPVGTSDLVVVNEFKPRNVLYNIKLNRTQLESLIAE